MPNEHLFKSVTADFAVEWTDAADGQRTWVYDDIHYNRPMPPLTQEIFANFQARMGRPPVFLNGYAFALSTGPTRPGPEMEGRDVFQAWRDEFQPRILAELAAMRSEDYEALSGPEAASRLRAAIDAACELHYLTMTVLQGFLAPAVALIEFLQAELGDEGATLAMSLLQGEANQTTGADAALGELAEAASQVPAVATALREGRFEALPTVEGGEAFLQRFRGFIETFGWRAESWSTPHMATWAEQPEQALRLVVRYLDDPQHAPAAGLQGAGQRRDAATREVESRLAADKLPRFHELLAGCREHVPWSEQRHFAQLLIFGSLRVPALAVGRKLVAAGAIEQPNDVFYLFLDEIDAVWLAADTSLVDVVEQRRRDIERWQQLTPPLSVGADPAGRTMTPAQLQFMRLFRGPATRLQQDGALIKGMGASRGEVTARARVIRDLSDADRLGPGEVLVCETTSAPWTPLFAIAGGVVTDSGGILSHSAICAREYGIPCVVGTSVATRRIPDGALVRIDGSQGSVEIVAV